MPLFGRAGLLFCLVALLVLLRPAPGHADPTFAIGTTSASPNPVAPGVTITITTSVTNTSPALASGIIVDEEIYDAAGVKVNQGTPSGQQYTPGQTFQAGETRTYQWFWTIPATLPAAQYTIKIGVFQDHWSAVYTWDNDAARFTVQAGGATIAFGVGTITATPTAIQPGERVSVSSQVTNTGTATATGINVLFELRDPLGQPFPGNQDGPAPETFAPGQSKSYTFQFTIPAGAPQGVYSASVAVYDSTWALRYAWKQNAEAVTVGTAVDPTFAIGAPTVSPGVVTTGQTLGVTVPVTAGSQPAIEIVVDVEIRDATDAKILQQYADTQAFAAGQRRDYSFAFAIPATMAPATYTVNVAIFNRTWSKLYAFGYHVGSFRVSATDPGVATLSVTKAGSGTGTVVSSPAGIDCGTACAARYSRGGTVIVLTATPGAGSVFTGWTGAGCGGAGPCRVTLTADTVVTATFGPAPPPPAGQIALDLAVSPGVLHAGDSLRVDLSVSNSGSARPVDLYFGLVLPAGAGPGFGCPGGDAVAFMADGFSRVVVACASSPPQGFPPLFRAAPLPGGMSTTAVPDFWSMVWQAGLPPGTYTVFAAMTSPGALADGRADAGDVLAVATKPVVATP